MTPKYHISYNGPAFYGTFSFHTTRERRVFRRRNAKEYGNNFGLWETESFRMGDNVNVRGDGTDTYEIIGFRTIHSSNDSVLLDSGFYESAYKIHKTFIE